MSTSAVLARPRERAPFMPYGAARLMWRSARRECLMAGPANTGKTRANLEKLHFCADKYAGMRGLILRKTRKSLTQSAIVTYEQKVLPYGWLGNLIHFDTQDQQYEYPNGSIIAISGLDDPQKVMSSEWDMIYVNEATELDEDDWQALTIRLRNKVMPYQQLLGDCNPGPPNHWLKLRCERGATLMLESRHEDNPSVTDEDLATLDALTGVWYLRYRKGLWVAAEGTVYQSEWNPAIHLIYRFELQPLWPRYWVIDWGYRNPFVWQAWAQDHDGNLYMYHEIYKTGTLVEDHAKQIMEVTANEPRPVAVICDHDAEDRATFERHTGYSTIAASKAISIGIQAVQSRLRVKGNGKAGMYFLRDSLVEIDKELAQKRDPICTTAEFERYEWDVSNGRKLKEVPVDKHNHGMDCLIAGTLITTDHGNVPIEHVKVGDYALTRQGYKRVKAAFMTTQHAKVYTVRFSNGATLTGTANHPVYLRDKGYTPLHAMRYHDIIEDINSCAERYPLCQTNQRLSPTRASLSGAIPNQKTGQIETTMSPILVADKKASEDCIRKFGGIRMGRSLKAIMSTIETKTRSTTRLKTLSVYLSQITMPIMSQLILRKSWHSDGNGLIAYAQQLLTGMVRKKAVNGTRCLGEWLGRKPNTLPAIASIVEWNFRLQRSGAELLNGFALITVKSMPACTQALMMRHASVPTATRSSELTSTTQRSVAPIYVLSVTEEAEEQAIYNLTVDNPVGEGEYFANGILVHNCNRYMAMHVDDPDGNVEPLDQETAGALRGFVGY